jgi:DNA phosphorothioation-associated putative methyltransferase
MNFKTYRTLVARIGAGKVLENAKYVHESAFSSIPLELLAFLERERAELRLPKIQYNVLKFYHKDFKASFLHYPDYFRDPYPCLQSSCALDFERQTHRLIDFSDSENPPILHRKETLLLPGDPRVPALEAVTREAELAGLYENPRLIGSKRSWERLISRKGYQLVDGRLVGKSEIPRELERVTNDVIVKRHLTAIDRDRLSRALQILARHDYLDGRLSVLDYGCGKGDDVRELEAHGIDVDGWDPVHRADGALRQADIVNLGYVINVIEDYEERTETLRRAYQYAKRMLVVSAMLAAESVIKQFRQYKDGVLTSRNTFQRYYSQSELRAYVESALKDSAIALAPGIFVVFRDKLEEQRFLSERQHIRRNWRQITVREPAGAARQVDRQVIEQNLELFGHFWDIALDLGRIPANDEFAFSERLRSVAGSHKRAFDALSAYYGREVFESAQSARRDDLLVYFALEQFAKRRPYNEMPEGLKRDIKSLFGGYRDAIGDARNLLFSVAHTDLIRSSCVEAYEKLGCGQLNEGHSFILHRDFLGGLPAVLRVYVGCATQLYGDVEGVDLIKIHMTSGKVTLMRYDDFVGKPIPELLERIKVKLREQDIDVFEYSGAYSPQPLYLKSRYISSSFEHYDDQIAFDRDLEARQLVDLSGFGAEKDELVGALYRAGLRIEGFKLVATEN